MTVNLIDTLKNCMVIHQISSYLLCQPEKEILQASELFKSLDESFNRLGINVRPNMDKILHSLSNSSHEALLIEYTRLFLGPFSVPASPYSSIYLDKEKQLYSDSTVWVESFYRQAGFEFDHKVFDLPDHFVIESEFLYMLLFGILSSLTNEDEIAASPNFHHYRDFRRKHHDIWVPSFMKRIEASTENEFYVNVARIIQSFIQTDVFKIIV